MDRPNILLANAHDFIGQEIGVTDWIDVDQMQINVFGEVTRWRTWTNSDQQRPRREGPHGDTIVHGFSCAILVTHSEE